MCQSAGGQPRLSLHFVFRGRLQHVDVSRRVDLGRVLLLQQAEM